MYVIGLVGPFGSGCTTVANKIKELKNYEVLSLSDELRVLFRNKYPNDEPLRHLLQEFGDEVRKKMGSGFLAESISKKMKDDGTNYVIDSIRNPEEINFFRKTFPEFFLFGIFADAENRWKRVSEKYDNDQREFEEDDKRDSGEKYDYGQRVTDSFRNADIIILNNNKIEPRNKYDKELDAKIIQNIEMIEKKIPFRPNVNETNMAIAYASSMRSSCLKRKVGAAIADAFGNVFSTGYNEVPSANETCLNEYGTCYRDKLKKDYLKGLETIIGDKNSIDNVYSLFKGKFKILDYCRALHAEENAILNVTRIGSSGELATSTLYTSTYPCNLCANKIAQVGIKRVVYFEPYPMAEAKKILQEKEVEQFPFEGVTYNGYFRLMEVIY